jgi:hypothetical protein
MWAASVGGCPIGVRTPAQVLDWRACGCARRRLGRAVERPLHRSDRPRSEVRARYPRLRALSRAQA